MKKKKHTRILRQSLDVSPPTLEKKGFYVKNSSNKPKNIGNKGLF